MGVSPAAAYRTPQISSIDLILRGNDRASASCTAAATAGSLSLAFLLGGRPLVAGSLRPHHSWHFGFLLTHAFSGRLSSGCASLKA